MLKKIFNTLLFFIVIAVLCVGGYGYWQYQKLFPNTDDAYIQANIVNISPLVSGSVVKIYVRNNQTIQKGQPLFDIDPTPFQLALNKAKAQLDNAQQQMKANKAAVTTAEAVVSQHQAELLATQKSTDRILTLVREKIQAQAHGDDAVRNLTVAKASLRAAISQLEQAQQQLGTPGENNASIRAARAAVKQAEFNLHHTHVVSPHTGSIAQFTLRQGSDVSAYRPLFTIVESKQWWITANFRETDLTRIKPGQTVRVKIDMYPQHLFKGVIHSISPGSGASFALLPPENASGNWVKVTQRFPVRIHIEEDPKFPLRLGASCTVTVTTSKQMPWPLNLYLSHE